MEAKSDGSIIDGQGSVDLGFFSRNPDKQVVLEPTSHAKTDGLRQAFSRQDIPRIKELFAADSKLCVEDFPGFAETELFLNNHGYNDATINWDDFETFIVSCCSLPSKPLLLELFRRRLYQQMNGIPINSSVILNLLSCYASKTSLEIVFRTLGDDLLELGKLRDDLLKNFITILYNFSLKGFAQSYRLGFVLEVLKDTLGPEKLSQLLTYQSGISPCGFRKVPQTFDAAMLKTLTVSTYLSYGQGLFYYDIVSKSGIHLRTMGVEQYLEKDVDILSPEQLERITKLTHRSPHFYYISSCIHEALYNESDAAYLTLIPYVLPHHLTILTSEGRKGVPLLWLLGGVNRHNLFQDAVNRLGNTSVVSFFTRTEIGKTILLDLLFCVDDPQNLRLLMTTLSGTVPQFLSSHWGTKALYGLLCGKEYTADRVRAGLTLYRDNDCWDVVEVFYAQHAYSGVEFNQHVIKILDEFRVHHSSGCALT